MVLDKRMIGFQAANGWLPDLVPILVSAGRGAPSGVPPPVLPFVHLHKPHDRMNTLVSPTPHLACLPFALAANGWPMLTSLMENLWQWCLLATHLQQLLGMNVASSNQWTSMSNRYLMPNKNSRGNWVGCQRLAGLAVVAVVVAINAHGAGLAVELAVEVAVALGAISLVVGRDGEEEASPHLLAKLGLRLRRRQGVLESLSLAKLDSVNSTGDAALPTAGRSSSEYVYVYESASSSTCSAALPTLPLGLAGPALRLLETAAAPPTDGALFLLPEPATRLLLPEPVALPLFVD